MNPLKNNVCLFHRVEGTDYDRRASSVVSWHIGRVSNLNSQFNNKMKGNYPWNASFNVFYFCPSPLVFSAPANAFLNPSVFLTSTWCCRPQPLPDCSVDCQPSWCIITFLMQRKACEGGGGKYRSVAMQENGCSPRITMSFISRMMNGNATSVDNNFVW